MLGLLPMFVGKRSKLCKKIPTSEWVEDSVVRLHNIQPLPNKIGTFMCGIFYGALMRGKINVTEHAGIK